MQSSDATEVSHRSAERPGTRTTDDARKPRILIVHNYYQQPGGEDMVVANERQLLIEHGHTVDQYSVTNDDIVGLRRKARVFIDLPYSVRSRDAFTAYLEKLRPDIVHVHNFFPLLTTSIYDACNALAIPIVQTLHNYRINCAGAFLVRDGGQCEKCVRGSPYWGVVHRCYRGSLIASLGVSRMIASNRRRGTWQSNNQHYIALTQCAKDVFIRGGIRPERVAVKPNFVADPGEPPASPRHGAIFVGRLSPEKGVAGLVSAWRAVDYPLRIIGHGPGFDELRAAAPANVTFVGRISHDGVLGEMRKAALLIVPSINIEGFPMVLAEAFSVGLPSIVSDIGAMREIVEDGETGLRFPPNNWGALVDAVNSLIRDEARLERLGRTARLTYLERYTPGQNYRQLLGVYRQCLKAQQPTAMHTST